MTGVPFGARVSPVWVSASFGHGDDVARLSLRHGLGLLASQHLQDVKLLVSVAPRISEHRVGPDRP